MTKFPILDWSQRVRIVSFTVAYLGQALCMYIYKCYIYIYSIVKQENTNCMHIQCFLYFPERKKLTIIHISEHNLSPKHL